MQTLQLQTCILSSGKFQTATAGPNLAIVLRKSSQRTNLQPRMELTFETCKTFSANFTGPGKTSSDRLENFWNKMCGTESNPTRYKFQLSGKLSVMCLTKLTIINLKIWRSKVGLINIILIFCFIHYHHLSPYFWMSYLA